jgi:uncharacterized cupredoxin-like copper-binding protein
MQITTSQEKENNWLASVGLGLGILVSVLLFGLVIARMGLLNNLVGDGETPPSTSLSTAVSSQNNSLIYTTQAMRFSQTELRVKAGETMTLQLENQDMYAHSFDIDELNLHVKMPANNQVTTQLTAEKPGAYAIYCAVPGHKEAGMVAMLIVEP